MSASCFCRVICRIQTCSYFPSIGWPLPFRTKPQDKVSALQFFVCSGDADQFNLLAAFVAREIPGPRRAIAVAVIIAGGAMVGWSGLTASGGVDVVEGIVLFTSASAVLSIYIFGLGYWRVSPFQALAVINIPNMVIFTPIWWFFLPSGLAEAETFDIVFQALFQGLGPGFLAVILITLSTLHLGATPTAGFSAAVPAGAALLAIPVLGEVPTAFEWGGVALVTVVLGVLVYRRKLRRRAE